MTLLRLLFGRPLASHEEGQQRVGPITGIPMLGLDALSSAAYGPEAAMTLLIPLGLAGVHYVWPISLVIIALLTIVFLSYWQTIGAYPGGGGSYTVARENLGLYPGLLAAAALLVDYVLVVAVGISAGVGALVSAVPGLQSHTLGLCLGILAIIALVNLRGVRESGIAFVLPTYLFVGSLFSVITLGLWRAWLAGGHPVAIVAPPAVPPAIEGARAQRDQRAPHAHGHHRHPDRVTRRHRLSRPRLPCCGSRSREPGLPERTVAARRSGRRSRPLLLRLDRLHFVGARAIG